VLGSADGSRAESGCRAAKRSPPRRVAAGGSPTAGPKRVNGFETHLFTGDRDGGRTRRDTLEASRMGDEGGVEREATLFGERGRSPIMNCLGRHECDARMPMLGVVPLKKLSAVRSSIFDRTETRWKIWP